MLDTPTSSWGRELVSSLEQRILPSYLQHCRWFGGKARQLCELRVVQQVAFPGTEVQVFVIECAFQEGEPEHYILPLVLVQGPSGAALKRDYPLKVLAQLPDETLLYDATQTPDFQKALFNGLTGDAVFSEPYAIELAKPLAADSAAIQEAAGKARVLSGEQSNTSISYADTWLVKFYRKYEAGPHPEVEMTEHLTRYEFNVPPFLSALTLQVGETRGVLAMLTHFTRHQNDGWSFTLAELAGVFDQAMDAQANHLDVTAAELIGTQYPERAAQLGRITARMHIDLAKVSPNPSFSTTAFTHEDGQVLHDAMLANAERVLGELERQKPTLSQDVQAMADTVLCNREALLKAYEKLLHVDMHFDLIRLHGDLHLGQILNTGDDFVVIDFEGEPRLSIQDRRLRRPALRDVAGMVRSFDYAAAAALEKVSLEDRETLAPIAQQWSDTVIKAYLDAYFTEAKDQSFLPQDAASTRLLLDLHIADKALYEIGYELNYRPHFASIPLSAVVKQIGALAE